MLMKERRSTIRSLRSWAIAVLQGEGAIHECEEHGCAKGLDLSDPVRMPAVYVCAYHGACSASADLSTTTAALASD